MIKIYMLNRGEDFARFKRGEPIQVGEDTIVQLESRLTVRAQAPAPESNNGAKPTKATKPAKAGKKTRRQYTDAFKQKIVAEAQKNGWSSYESGKHHGISGSVVLRWLRDAKKAKA